MDNTRRTVLSELPPQPFPAIDRVWDTGGSGGRPLSGCHHASCGEHRYHETVAVADGDASVLA